MTYATRSYHPLNRNPRMAPSRAQTGSDIRHFTVFCSNSVCRSVIGRDGHEAMPTMNYHGTKFALFSSHRVHVYACSICNREKHYRRRWFGKEWQRIR